MCQERQAHWVCVLKKKNTITHSGSVMLSTHLLYHALNLLPTECLLVQQLSSKCMQLGLMARQDATRTVIRPLHTYTATHSNKRTVIHRGAVQTRSVRVCMWVCVALTGEQACSAVQGGGRVVS